MGRPMRSGRMPRVSALNTPGIIVAHWVGVSENAFPSLLGRYITSTGDTPTRETGLPWNVPCV